MEIIGKTKKIYKSEIEIKREVERLKNRIKFREREPEYEEVVREFIALCKKFEIHGYQKAAIYLKCLLSIYLELAKLRSVPKKQACSILLLMMRLSISPLTFSDLRCNLDRLDEFCGYFLEKSSEKVDLGQIELETDNFEFMAPTDSITDLEVTNNDSNLLNDKKILERETKAENEIQLKRLFVPIIANYWYRPQRISKDCKKSFLYEYDNFYILTDHQLLHECLWLLMGIDNSCFKKTKYNYQLSTKARMCDISWECSHNYVRNLCFNALKLTKISEFINEIKIEHNSLNQFYRRILIKFLHELNIFLSQLENLTFQKKIKSISSLTKTFEFAVSSINCLSEVIIRLGNKYINSFDGLLNFLFKNVMFFSSFSNTFTFKVLMWAFLNTYKKYFHLINEYLFFGSSLESLNITLEFDFKKAEYSLGSSDFNDKVSSCAQILNLFSHLISIDKFKDPQITSILQSFIESSFCQWKYDLEKKICDVSNETKSNILTDIYPKTFVDSWTIIADIKKNMSLYILSCSKKINEYFISYVKNNIDIDSYIDLIQAVYICGCCLEILEFRESLDINEFNKIRFTSHLQSYFRNYLKNAEIIQVKKPKYGCKLYTVSFICPFPMNLIIQSSHMKQLNLIHNKIILILFILEDLKKLKISKNLIYHVFINLVRWKFLVFLNTVYNHIQNTVHFVLIPFFRKEIKNANSYIDLTELMNRLIDDLSISVFLNKESFILSKTINLILQYIQDFVNIWKEDEINVKKIREIYLIVNERVDLLKDHLVLVSQVLKNENYVNLSYSI